MYHYIEGIVQEWSNGDDLGFGKYIMVNDTKVHVPRSGAEAHGYLKDMICGRLVILAVEKVHGEWVLMKAPAYR